MAGTSGRKGRPWRRAVEIVKARSQICALCGEAIDLDLQFPDSRSFSVDHTVPLSQLGPDDPRRTDPDYLQPAHLGCNAARQNMTLAEWRAKQADAAGDGVQAGTSRRWL